MRDLIFVSGPLGAGEEVLMRVDLISSYATSTTYSHGSRVNVVMENGTRYELTCTKAEFEQRLAKTTGAEESD